MWDVVSAFIGICILGLGTAFGMVRVLRNRDKAAKRTVADSVVKTSK